MLYRYSFVLNPVKDSLYYINMYLQYVLMRSTNEFSCVAMVLDLKMLLYEYHYIATNDCVCRLAKNKHSEKKPTFFMGVVIHINSFVIKHCDQKVLV